MFPAGTEIAFEIHAALKNCKFITLYGATSVPCHADFVFKNCFGGVPFVDDPQLIDALNEIIDSNGIDFIYPAHDSALLRLTQDQRKLNAKVITSDLKTVEICRNKNKTYKYLYGASYVPKYYMNADDISDYPVFAKPAVGQGSEGAVKAEDKWALYRILLDGREYAVCEYLPGAEFTVDCFTDRKGELRYIGQRTRDRIRSGIAVRSEFVEIAPKVTEIAHDLNDKLCFNGAWFFQIKKDAKGEYKLLEVAPRIAGTMGLSRNRGVNLPLLTIYNHLGVDVEIVANNNKILLDRAFISRFKTDLDYDNIYVDLDDTLIVNGRVNQYLLAFLYQAKDNGKRIILLTKHSGSALKSLQDSNIDINLFNSVISIPCWGSKADYVETKSIFIDDSFAERKKVHEVCGVSVYDVDMVESLFDWSA